MVLLGLLLDAFVISADPEMEFHIAMIGVILYGTSFLFTLVTLPVEINASRRAGKMLLQEGILTTDEMLGAKKVLSAAALTYLASLMTSLVYFLCFFIYVLTLFGRRNDRRYAAEESVIVEWQGWQGVQIGAVIVMLLIGRKQLVERFALLRQRKGGNLR